VNKYPKRGGDCEHTMDCMWGADGWCDRLEGSKCEIQKMDEARAAEAKKEDALRRLVKLGDMMGDGLHHEPGGEWIEKEYRRAMKQAGIASPRKRSDPSSVNEFMERRVAEEKCTCGSPLKQTRSGSFRAKCVECGKVWQLGGKKR